MFDIGKIKVVFLSLKLEKSRMWVLVRNEERGYWIKMRKENIGLGMRKEDIGLE